MVDPDSQAGNSAVALLLFRSEFFITWLLPRLDHNHVDQSIALKASILNQATPIWQNQACFICDFLVVLLTFASGSEQNDLGLSIENTLFLMQWRFFLLL